jgi:hypothetical protein
MGAHILDVSRLNTTQKYENQSHRNRTLGHEGSLPLLNYHTCR